MTTVAAALKKTLPPRRSWFAKRRAEGSTAADAASLGSASGRMAQLLEADDLSSRYGRLRLALLTGVPAASDDAVVVAVALMHRAIQLTLGVVTYNVQRQAAIIMARGGVAEMATGEGKTFAVAMAAASLAASGRSVHVATANPYLAERDYRALQPAFERLGLRVALAKPQQPADARQQTYACDIVYGTADTFAFDFLHDAVDKQTAERLPLGAAARAPGAAGRWQAACRRRHTALVDEIDHVLIDEAEMPLILTSPGASVQTTPEEVFIAADTIAKRMQRDRDWLRDGPASRARLTDAGRYETLRLTPTATLPRPWPEYVERAIEANALLRRDVDYVLRDGQVALVDPATGRIQPDRRWSNGLHQAVEVREQLAPSAEVSTVAQITRWRFFLQYHQLAGCSGTAWDCRRELQRVYRLRTTPIPLRCASQLQILEPLFFPDRPAKLRAMVAEIAAMHASGRPVLVGTRTIADSEQLADQLRSCGLPSQLLHGNQPADEAAVVAAAGRRGAITVATDLAGRGTDIQLTPEVIAAGGLHVIVAEPRRSPRLDRQLIGRAARQGQPGTARVFVAADDPLIRRHGRPLGRMLSAGQRRGCDTAILWRGVQRAAARAEAEATAARLALAQRETRHSAFFNRRSLPCS